MKISISNIPLEILVIILKLLDFDSRKTCKQVCSLWLEILMTEFEFKNDRQLKLTNCYFDTTLAPVSVFINSKYEYESSCISIDKIYTNLVIKDDISAEFWNKIGAITLNMDDLRGLKLWPSKLNTIKSITLVIDCDYLIENVCDYFTTMNICFHNIKFIIIKNSVKDDDAYMLSFSKIFPYLESLLIENKTNTVKSPISIMKVKNLWIPYSNDTINTKFLFDYENLYAQQQMTIGNFYENPQYKNANIVSDLKITSYLPSFLEHGYKIPDNSFDIWNYYQNIKQLSLGCFSKQCFFAHKIISYPLEVLHFEVSNTDCCLLCLNSLFNSFKKLHTLKLHLVCHFENKYVNLKLIFSHWKFLQDVEITCSNREIPISMYYNFMNVSSIPKYHTLKKLKLTSPHMTDLKFITTTFPNLQILRFILYAKYEFDYFHLLKSLISMDDCQIKILQCYVCVNSMLNNKLNNNTIKYQNDIASYISKYGKKLSVSI